MRVAVLIGLSYQNSIERTLPGVSIDLYLMTKLADRAGMDRVVVITDLCTDEPEDILTEAIIGEFAERDLYHFIAQIKAQGRYERFRSKAWLVERLEQLTHDSTDLLIYYSGHGSKKQFILPSLERLPMDSLLDYCDHPCRAFLIVDCCNASLSLPYRYQRRFRLSSKERFIKGRVLSILSSQDGENAYSSRHGSTFTRALARSLGLVGVKKGPSHSLTSWLKELRSLYQHATIDLRSSYPKEEMWPWLLGKRLNVTIGQGAVIVSLH